MYFFLTFLTQDKNLAVKSDVSCGLFTTDSGFSTDESAQQVQRPIRIHLYKISGLINHPFFTLTNFRSQEEESLKTLNISGLHKETEF